MGVDALATELALLERDLLLRVTPEELVNYHVVVDGVAQHISSTNSSAASRRTSSLRRRHAPNIHRLLGFVRRLVQLIQTQIVGRQTVDSRAEVLVKWIRVATRCLDPGRVTCLWTCE